MSVDPRDMTKYADHKIAIVYVPSEGGDAVEEEGVASISNEVGVLFKKRGTTMARLIEIERIDEIHFIIDAPKVLKQKILKDPTEELARQHLLDRHGYTLEKVNSMEDFDGADAHNEINHGPLGHIHKTEAEAKNADETEGE